MGGTMPYYFGRYKSYLGRRVLYLDKLRTYILDDKKNGSYGNFKRFTLEEAEEMLKLIKAWWMNNPRKNHYKPKKFYIQKISKMEKQFKKDFACK